MSQCFGNIRCGLLNRRSGSGRLGCGSRFGGFVQRRPGPEQQDEDEDDYCRKDEVGAFDIPDSATYVRKLGEIFGVKFYLVDANVVRNQYKVDFALGGNNGPYDWVPRDEIWLDAATQPSELPYIALHEFYERHRMLQNGLDYNKAHAIASIIEWKAREGKKLPQEHVSLMQFICNAARI